LQQKDVSLELTHDAKQFIIDQGFNPEYGARPLRRAIQRLLEDPLAEEVLRGSFPTGTVVEVSVVDGHLHFKSRQGEPTQPAPEAAEVAPGDD
ncbi:MAG: NDP-hexose 4-ketoreductase, partial [Planctomycetes bacterium]|nr:NDP-hexose 4-ketoreductase [Planctomycetota bacterium]